jgi:hypothetical protein
MRFTMVADAWEVEDWEEELDFSWKEGDQRSFLDCKSTWCCLYVRI